ncbi:PiggyBac transposable element-derived protein 4-like [Plakobranchus ocellatus]|uniref:PiggyBac transposable element-derived protein 4-like n=1 Tax=Plakobranchus ocellatus TaxID=259542 RepID=A0AAV4ADF1_9GAST|nr:PiggyBac transposable element-derived protein 4-like [Plakobranchus ocellatus]
MEDQNSDTELAYESDVDLNINDKDEEADNAHDDGDAAAAAPAEGAADPGGWMAQPSDVVMQDFQQQPGPRHNLDASACPIHFFFLMFPLALFEVFVTETNCYAEQCIAQHPNSSWYPTWIEEMRAFLAIQIFFGIPPRPRLWMYWSEDPRFHDSYISSIMTIARFKNLSQYFHCRDTSNAPRRDQPAFDPLFKVRNIVSKTQETFRAHFQAQRELSVDEAMVGFKGRLSFKQYMPKKPMKWGIKVWTVSDARLGYCLGYDIYTGKASRRDPHRPLGFEVVDNLCQPHYSLGHHVYMDRFFSSVELAEHLLQNNTYMCSTIVSNRTGLPPVVKRKLKTRGELVQRQKNNLVATSFHDKRTITLLSSNQLMGTAPDGRPHQLVTTIATWEVWMS